MAEPWKGGPWKPGQSGNPNGRKPGRRNAKTRAILKKLDGKADSLALLAEMVAAAETPLSLRMHAAIGLARYQHAPAPRLLRKKIDLPEPTTIAQATANIGRISTLVAQRKLGVDEGNDLTAILGKWIEAKVSAELEERIVMIEIALAKANINLGIAVEGGLPDLPLGPDDGRLIMPAKLLSTRAQPSELPSDKPPLNEPPPTDGDAP
jgi:hypothetical protein